MKDYTNSLIAVLIGSLFIVAYFGTELGTTNMGIGIVSCLYCSGVILALIVFFASKTD